MSHISASTVCAACPAYAYNTPCAICRFLQPILLFGFSYWVPQIVHCAQADVKQPLRPLYIIGMSVTRLILPLYMYGCPSNVLRMPPSPWFCALLSSWVVLQVMAHAKLHSTQMSINKVVLLLCLHLASWNMSTMLTDHAAGSCACSIVQHTAEHLQAYLPTC